MKLFHSVCLTVCLLVGLSSAALAESLGDVIRDSVRDELRDGVRDSVRRTVCPPGQQPDGRGVCNTLEDIDQVRDDLRRGRNTIRAIDAIFD